MTALSGHCSTDWTQHLPSDWSMTRLGNVADILLSNVDKHSLEDEVPVRLCNYVDVYNTTLSSSASRLILL